MRNRPSRTTPTRMIDMQALDVGRERVATHAQLMACGVPRSSITYRIAPNGRWQRLHPGVVLMHRGAPTRRELLLGALALAGPDSMISGHAALSLYGLRTVNSNQIMVLIPADRRRQSRGSVLLERTHRLPDPSFQRGIPAAPLARAVVDACRRTEDLNAAREMIADAVQHHGLSLRALNAEVRAAARQRTAVSRRVLAEMQAGVRSAAEARAREVIRAHAIVEPLWNAEVLTGDGAVIARPDALWTAWLAAMEINSLRWHLSPADFEYTLSRQGLLIQHGLIVLPVTPARILSDELGFIQDVQGLLRVAQQRKCPSDLTFRRANA